MHKNLAKNCIRFSIVRYDGLVWMIETKQARGSALLCGPGEKGRIINNDREVEVLYTPAQLAVLCLNNPAFTATAILMPVEKQPDPIFNDETILHI